MASLTRAVGRGAENPIKSEVLLVQQLLNRHRPPSLKPIDEDGRQGDETCKAIEEFQRRVMKLAKPDGRVDPGGKTFKALCQPPAGLTPPTVAGPAAGGMILSDAGRKLLRGVEALSLTPYDDQSRSKAHITAWVKGATIGYGHLISRAEWDTYRNGISEAGANALFDRDLAPFEAAVRNSIKVTLSANQFDALIMLAFNIGAGSFARSSVVKLVNDPTANSTYKSLEAAWKSWNKSQGKVMKGLDNRRQCEWDVYSRGVYNRW